MYFLTPNHAVRLVTPPTMKNQRNYVASLSQLGRWLGEQAEEAGATILPETSGTSCSSRTARVLGVRTGDKGRGRNGAELVNFEPGSDIRARVTVLAEGTQGHLTGVAIDHFGLQGENPQVWALGVKEVWKVAKPLDRVIHTLGWPLRPKARFREFGGSFIYPMGEDMVTIGMVVGLDYRDVQLSVHDLLQELKTHLLVRDLLEGGERVAWGAKTIPEGGLLSLPSRLHAPGLLLTGDGAGFVNVPALKGIHYAVESGRLAAEAAFHAIGRGETPWRPGGLESYDASAARELHLEGPGGSAEHAPGLRPRVLDGLGARRDDDGDEGQAAAAADGAPSRTPSTTSSAPAAPRQYPKPDGTLTFDKLSSVFLSGNRTRDDAPDHLRVRHHVPRDLAELWEYDVPGAGLRARARCGERRRRARGDALQLRPVRRYHREGRTADAARGRLRAGVHGYVASARAVAPDVGARVARDPDRAVRVQGLERPVAACEGPHRPSRLRVDRKTRSISLSGTQIVPFAARSGCPSVRPNRAVPSTFHSADRCGRARFRPR